MTIRDERLKARALRAIDLQQAGHFVLDHRQELPLPVLDLRYSRLYDVETRWGGFRFDPEARSRRASRFSYLGIRKYLLTIKVVLSMNADM